jgi:putative ABC transport system ATP-binding protein
MIEVQSLQHRYDGVPVLDLPALSVPQGGRLLLLGPSGSGKTTLLHVLAGLLRPTEGRVVVCGHDLYALDERARDRFRGRFVGLVFQRLHLLDVLTVQQNLDLAVTLARVPAEPGRVRETLARLDLAEKAGAYPHQLSMGQRQRVAIARAVINRPSVILADEPTAALDSERARSVMDLLRRVAAERQAAVLVVTHDEKIFDRFDRMVALRDGRIDSAA